jgi:hypothetical protein
MAKIEIEVDDALLARATATGCTIQELGAAGFEMAVTDREFNAAMNALIEDDEEMERQRAGERDAWAQESRPVLAASWRALQDEFGGRSDADRMLSLSVTEEQAATFAWLSLAMTAWTKTRPPDKLRIDLDDPAHWQAAQDYARRALYRHFKEQRSALEWGKHPLLVDEQQGNNRPED